MERSALPTVPLLTGSNYLVWAMKMEAILSLKKLDKMINEEKPEENAEQKTRTEWETKNKETVAYIRLHLSDEQALQFATENEAKLLWIKIKNAYAGAAEDQKIDASNDLKFLRMEEKETVSNYIARARGLATKCASLGLNVTPRELVYYTVRGINNQYKDIREILKTQREKSLEEIHEILKEREKEYQRRGSYIRETDGAYAVQRKNDKRCYNCGRSGHIAKLCWNRKNYKEDHHRATNNYKRDGRRDNETNRGITERKKSASSIVKPVNGNDKKYAFMITNSDSVSNTYENWLFDSGATNHMANDLKWFSNIDFQAGDLCQAGVKSSLRYEGIGSVEIETRNENNEVIIIEMSDVLFVPQLRENLLSTTTLMKKGYKIVQQNNVIVIIDKENNAILTGELIDKRLKFLAKPYNVEDYKYSYNIGKPSDTDHKTWHKRLGHINDQYLSKMNKDNLVDGMHVYFDDNFVCESCNLSKITRKPHKVVTTDQSKQPLELIHGDLCGPISTESLNGSRYMLVLIDDFSGMYFTYFLKYKNEVCEKFVSFKEKYENLLNVRVKRFRTDNGREFLNRELDEFLENNGIIHEKTIPYNPESNGKAERANRTILERTKNLLYDSKLPNIFWAEAAACVSHVTNVTFRKNKNRTPFELFFGMKPNVNYLRVFGCTAYCYVPKQKRDKLNLPGKIGIMVGYARERRGYRVYISETGKVLEERTVNFNENDSGARLINKNYKDSGEYNLLTYLEPEQNETEIQENNEINVDVNSEINNEENEHFIEAERRPRGRPRGTTREVIEARECLRREENNTNREGVRRSERLREKSVNLVEQVKTPSNYDEARNSKNWIDWEKAMREELKSFDKHSVWEIVDKPNKEKITKSKWVLTVKNDKENKNVKFKARLVAAGYNYVKNKDYEESYSPVVSIEAWRLFIALASKLKLNLRFFDVKTAYLYGNLLETVYLTLPPGFEDEYEKDKVLKLKKSIYGLPQSGRNWYLKFKNTLIQLGFKPLTSENCIFILKNQKVFIAISVYVDDFSIIDNNSKYCNEILTKLRQTFEINETTKNNMFLNIKIEKTENGITLSQTEYITKLLREYNLDECKPVNTPIVPGEDKVFEKTDDVIDIDSYKEIIGELLYLANRTRPDIAFVTSYLSQFNNRPEKRHFLLAKRVLRYLQGTREKGLFYSNKMGTLRAYSDSSWGNGENGKSFSGGVIMLEDSLILWKSNKQKCVGLSTCVVELFACSDVVKDVKWLSNLLIEMKLEMFLNKPVVIHCDNTAAIEWMRSVRSSNKTRHVNLRFHFVRDELEKSNIDVKYVETKYMIADFLTKAVTHEKLIWTLRKINAIDLSNIKT